MKAYFTVRISSNEPPYEIVDSFDIPASLSSSDAGKLVADTIKDFGSRGFVIKKSLKKYRYIPPTRIREIDFEILED